ncbi:MAG: hypothetical protein MUD10_03825 [Candidatus Pacebacteria bacterium]|nr:hypothetical protein [Candidatus Paceibacterota bacterium]
MADWTNAWNTVTIQQAPNGQRQVTVGMIETFVLEPEDKVFQNGSGVVVCRTSQNMPCYLYKGKKAFWA